MYGKRTYWTELILYAILGVLLLWLLVELDALERLYALTRRGEFFELDELLLSIPVLLLLLVAFSVRRLAEMRSLSRELAATNLELVDARMRVESLTRVKEEFLSYASHELKNPLAGVVSALRLIEAARDEGRLDEGLALARGAAESLRANAMDVLEVTRLLMGHSPDRSAFFDPRLALDQALAPALATAREKGIALTLEIDSEVPEILKGHEALLRHVVQNLADNAVKFTDQGGVDVRCTCFEDGGGDVGSGGGEDRGSGGRSGECGSDGMLVVTVSDTGPGIAPELASVLFEPYVQGPGAPAIPRGVGLGLSIAKRLAEVLGGALSVHSDGERGAAFRLEIPLDPQRQHPGA